MAVETCAAVVEDVVAVDTLVAVADLAAVAEVVAASTTTVTRTTTLVVPEAVTTMLTEAMCIVSQCRRMVVLVAATVATEDMANMLTHMPATAGTDPQVKLATVLLLAATLIKHLLSAHPLDLDTATHMLHTLLPTIIPIRDLRLTTVATLACLVSAVRLLFHHPHLLLEVTVAMALVGMADTVLEAMVDMDPLPTEVVMAGTETDEAVVMPAVHLPEAAVHQLLRVAAAALQEAVTAEAAVPTTTTIVITTALMPDKEAPMDRSTKRLPFLTSQTLIVFVPFFFAHMQ